MLHSAELLPPFRVANSHWDAGREEMRKLASMSALTQFRHLMTNWTEPSRFQDIPGLSGRIDPEAKPVQRSRRISMV
jgi:hypothetical protein